MTHVPWHGTAGGVILNPYPNPQPPAAAPSVRAAPLVPAYAAPPAPCRASRASAAAAAALRASGSRAASALAAASATAAASEATGALNPPLPPLPLVPALRLGPLRKVAKFHGEQHACEEGIAMCCLPLAQLHAL